MERSKYLDNIDYVEKVKNWESTYGNDIQERTTKTAISVKEYRTNANLPLINNDQVFHNKIIHNIGKQVMQMRISEKKQKELDAIENKIKSVKVGKLLRKKIAVDDLDDGGLSVSLDQDWDTSSWSTEMIEAGCEALVLIFQEVGVGHSMEHFYERKQRASVMLDKLLFRHHQANTWARVNIESMIGQSVNRLIRNGKSQSTFDVLYVLHVLKVKMYKELSTFKFSGRAHEMMMGEMRLAAIMIQHTYRSMVVRTRFHPPNPMTDCFGDPKVMRDLRLSVINARSLDLRLKWQVMHSFWDKSTKNKIGGLRGPIYVGQEYVILILEIILNLVSEKCLDKASSNREDIIDSHGIFLLTGFLAAVNGPYAELSLQVLSNIAKHPKSCYEMLHCGIISAATKYLIYIKKLTSDLEKNVDKKCKIYKLECTRLLNLMYHVNFLIYRTALHVAGLFRALGNYRYTKPGNADEEPIDYKVLLLSLGSRYKPDDVIKRVGYKDLISQLFDSILSTKHLNTMRSLLNTVLTISSSQCLDCVATELCMYGGRSMIRIIELLEEQDEVINSMALSIFLQVCTTEIGRNKLIKCNISKYISPLTKKTKNYNRKPYQRSIFIIAALCRQEDWYAYDSQELPKVFDEDFAIMRAMVIYDILRTMKQPKLNLAENLTVADLTVLPVNKELSLAMSKTAEVFVTRDLADFLTHPNDEKYFESLPLDESAAVCIALEGLSMHLGTAMNLFSEGIVNFLGKCMFVGKLLIAGPPLSERKTVLILNGVAGAANALSNMCKTGIISTINASEMINGVRKSDLYNACTFFIGTLAVAQSKDDPGLAELQAYIGRSIVSFVDNYCEMLALYPRSDIRNEELEALTSVGKAVVHLIKELFFIHEKGSAYMKELLADSCKLLLKFTTTQAGVDNAVNWKCIASLRIYLPSPLSGIGELGNDEPAYKLGLEMIPADYFFLCANLCQIEQGKSNMLLDGFLRRALDKLSILCLLLENKNILKSWSTIEMNGKPLPNPSQTRIDCTSCLKLISKMANFNNPQYGSANDQILKYDIIGICVRIVKIEECPLNDECYVNAMECLGALSNDKVRVCNSMEGYDLLNICNIILTNAEKKNINCVRSAIEIISNMASGVKSLYLKENLPKLNQNLSRCMRVVPKFIAEIRNAMWYIMKCLMEGAIQSQADNTNIDHVISKNQLFDEDSLQMSPFNSKYENSSSKLELDTSQYEYEWGGHGTYEACGPSSCGSLRYQDQPRSHGNTLNLTQDDMMHTLLNIHDTNLNQCEISKLSARDKLFRDKLLDKKIHEGFTDKKMEPQFLNTSPIKKNNSNNQFEALEHSKSLNNISLISNISNNIGNNKLNSKNNKQQIISSPIKSIQLDECPQLMLTKPPRKKDPRGIF